MQALGHCRVARRRVTHPMPTLMSNWKAIECRHWSTEKSSNACIGRQWSKNAGIGRQWCKTIQALTHYEVTLCRHWTFVWYDHYTILWNNGDIKQKWHILSRFVGSILLVGFFFRDQSTNIRTATMYNIPFFGLYFSKFTCIKSKNTNIAVAN